MEDRQAKLEAARAKLKKFQLKKAENSAGSSSNISQRSSSICSSEIRFDINSGESDLSKDNGIEAEETAWPSFSRNSTPIMVQQELVLNTDQQPIEMRQQQEQLGHSSTAVKESVILLLGPEAIYNHSIVDSAAQQAQQNAASHSNSLVSLSCLTSHEITMAEESLQQSETLKPDAVEINADSRWREEYALIEAELFNKQRAVEMLTQEKACIERRCVFLETELEKCLEQLNSTVVPSIEVAPTSVDQGTDNHFEARDECTQTVNSDQSCHQCLIWENRVNELHMHLTEIARLSDTRNHMVEALQDDNRVLNRALEQNAHLRAQLEEVQTRLKASMSSPSVHTDQAAEIKVTNDRSLEVEFQDLQRRFMSLQDRCTLLEVTNAKLEREVLQLDGETHTIGEYVLLYREQREKLRNRAYHLQYLDSELSRIKNCFLERLQLLEQLISQESSTDFDQEAQQITPDPVKENMILLFMGFMRDLKQLDSNWPNWTESDYSSLDLPKLPSHNSIQVFQSLSDALVNFNSTHTAPCDIPSCKCCTGQLVNL